MMIKSVTLVKPAGDFNFNWNPWGSPQYNKQFSLAQLNSEIYEKKHSKITKQILPAPWPFII